MANNKIIYNSKVLLDLTQDTVSSEKLLANTTAHDRSGNIITGTIETKSSDDLIVNGATINVPKGYYSIQASKSVSSITQATPSISVSSSGLVTATSTQSAGYVVEGTKSATKQLSVKGSATYTPTTTDLTISSGLYLTGNQIIKGDSNLKSENIKKGVSIFGIAGTHEGETTEDLSEVLTEQDNIIAEIANSLDVELEEETSSEESDLPEEYQEVEYIEGTGTQYIDTRLNYFADFEIGIKLRTNVSNKALGNGQLYCMQRQNATTGCWQFTSGSSAYNTTSKITEYHAMMWKNNNVYSDGVQLGSLTKSRNAGSNMLLFTAQTNQKYPNVIYFCKMWDNDVLVRDFIPCYRKADNEIGMYDKVTNTFFTNSGTGVFIKGDDIGSNNYAQKIQSNNKDLEVILDKVNNLSEPIIEELNITENGTYTTPSGVDGYNPIIVNVPIPDGYIKPSGNINITNTNSINVTNYATARVVDTNLIASNIKSGVSILGVEGTLEEGTGETYEEYDGTFEGNAEIVLQGYNISFATGNQYISQVCYYSLDNGTTWNDFYDIRNNANPVLTNVTQIKFKTIRRGTSYLYAGYIKIPSLSIKLSSSSGNTYISDNIQLTNDVSDLTISYMQSVSGGGSED